MGQSELRCSYSQKMRSYIDAMGHEIINILKTFLIKTVKTLQKSMAESCDNKSIHSAIIHIDVSLGSALNDVTGLKKGLRTSTGR